jgi:hypothetical protein
MDGSSFDKLGGTAAAVGGVFASQSESDAKKKKHCRSGYGGRCNSNKDCCNGNCRNGRCWYNGNGNGNGGNNGGRYCNGVRCVDGWRCCYFQGYQRCLPETHAACLGSGECPNTWDTCGWNGSIRQCCGLGQQCCYSNTFDNYICLSDQADCDDFFRSADVDGESISSFEGTSEPIPVTDIDPAEYE